MKNIKKLISVVLCVSILFSLAISFSSCSDNEHVGDGTITIKGHVNDHNGVSAEGLTIVMIDVNNNDYSVEIGKNGDFTANGILIDTQMALSIEDSNGNGLTQVSYFNIVSSDEVTLGALNGKNTNGYVYAYSRPDVETLYITFELTDDNRLAIHYFSDECPESEAKSNPETTQEVQTTKSEVLF